MFMLINLYFTSLAEERNKLKIAAKNVETAHVFIYFLLTNWQVSWDIFVTNTQDQLEYK